MKAFRCYRVTCNSVQKWVVQVVEDGGDYEMVAGSLFYSTLADCEAAMLRLDAAENGQD